MAVIRQYEAPVQGLRPNETGAEAFQRAGYSIRSSYRELGEEVGRGISVAGNAASKDINQYYTQRAVSQISAHSALLGQNLHDQWNQIAKADNGTNPNVGKDFLANVVEPRLQKFQEQYSLTQGGREYAMRVTNSIRNTLYHTVAADTSTMAADAAVKNLTTFSNATQTQLYQNPEGLSDKLSTIDATVDALVKSHPDLTPGAAAKMRDEMTTKLKEAATKSAFLGMADRSPALAEKALDAGTFGQYLDGSQAHQYIKMAERTQKEEARQAEILARLNGRVAAEAATNSYLTALKTGADGTLIVPKGWLNSVLKNPDLKPAEKTALWNFAHAHDGGKAGVGDSPTFTALGAKATDGTLTAADLGGAVVSGDITLKQYHLLDGIRKEVANNPAVKTDMKAFGVSVKSYQHYIDGSNPLAGRYDAQGAQRYGEFVNDKTDEFRAGLAKGWSRQSMLNPGGEHYIFGDVKSYETTPTIGGVPVSNPLQQQPLSAPATGLNPGQQATANAAVAAANSLPKLETGESPEHFARRLMDWNNQHHAGNQ